MRGGDRCKKKLGQVTVNDNIDIKEFGQFSVDDTNLQTPTKGWDKRIGKKQD